MAQITLTIPDELVDTYNRFRAEHDRDWVDPTIVKNLRNLEKQHRGADLKKFEDNDLELFRDKFRLLPPGIKISIRQHLRNV